eukprot:3084433-Karenia_brevis.AAC.1
MDMRRVIKMRQRMMQCNFDMIVVMRWMLVAIMMVVYLLNLRQYVFPDALAAVLPSSLLG